MKRFISALLVSLFALTLFSCSGRPAEVKSGFYYKKGEDMGPYVCFDTEAMTWRCGGGIAISYSIGGKYEIVGDRIVATGDRDGVKLEFRRTGDFEITAISASLPDRLEWVKKGDVFRYNSSVLHDLIVSADDGLGIAKSEGVVVIENATCTAGRELWDEFFSAAESGKQASVTVARYYGKTIDSAPSLFFSFLYYDGEEFTVSVRKSTDSEPETNETFKYLIHNAGDNSFLPNAEPGNYDAYFLADDPDATYEEIIKAMLSSTIDFSESAGYRHCIVFSEYSHRDSADERTPEVKTGAYFKKGEDKGSYIRFNTEDRTWTCGAGLGFSFSLGGTYETDGDRIVAKGDRDDLLVELKVQSDHVVTATAVTFPGSYKWFSPGDTLIYNSLSFYNRVVSAEEGLKEARAAGIAVVEESVCTSGSDKFYEFLERARSGMPADITVAKLTCRHDRLVGDVPILTFEYVSYDGDGFSVTVRNSEEEKPEYTASYEYLICDTGELDGDRRGMYDAFYLVDDTSLTRERIEADRLRSFDSGLRYREILIDNIYFD